MATTYSVAVPNFPPPTEKYDRLNEATFRRQLERSFLDIVAYQEQLIADPISVTEHVIATTSAVGAQHTVAGLTAKQVLRAASATTAKFQQLAFSDLSGSIADAQTPESAVTQHEAALAIAASQVEAGTFADDAHYIFQNDISIGDLGRFDSSDTPTESQLLVYKTGTSKWIADSVQFVWGSGDFKAGPLADGSAVTFVFLDPGEAGAADPPDTPDVPVVHSAHLIHTLELRDYTKNANFRYLRWKYRKDGGDWTDLVESTSTKVVHSRLTADVAYTYRVKAIGRDGDATAWAVSADATAAANSETHAFGAIIAGEIAVANLTALSADIGEITTGKVRNSGDTAGILFGGSLPAGWTSFMDLTASDTFLRATGDNTRVEISIASGDTPKLIVTAASNVGDLDQIGLSLRRARGTIASPTSTRDTNQIGHILFYGYDGSGYDLGAKVTVIAAEHWSDSVHGTIFQFQTATKAGTTVTTRLSLDSAGATFTVPIDIGANTLACGDTTISGSLDVDNALVITDSVTAINVNISGKFGLDNWDIRDTGTTFELYDGTVRFSLTSAGGTFGGTLNVDGALTVTDQAEVITLLMGTSTAFDVTKTLALGYRAGGSPTGVSGQCALYAWAAGGAGSAELWAMDAGGTASQQTPHNPATGEWWVNSMKRVGNEIQGKQIHVERLLRAIVDQLPGLQYEDYFEEYTEVA